MTEGMRRDEGGGMEEGKLGQYEEEGVREEGWRAKEERRGGRRGGRGSKEEEGGENLSTSHQYLYEGH